MNRSTDLKKNQIGVGYQLINNDFQKLSLVHWKSKIYKEKKGKKLVDIKFYSARRGVFLKLTLLLLNTFVHLKSKIYKKKKKKKKNKEHSQS